MRCRIAGRTVTRPSADTSVKTAICTPTCAPRTAVAVAANAPTATISNTNVPVKSSAAASSTPAINHHTHVSTLRSWHAGAHIRTPSLGRRRDNVPPSRRWRDREMSLRTETVQVVDETVAASQARGRVPAVVVGVVRDGVLAHVSVAGDAPAPPAGTQYRIGSISKTMTAALVMGFRDDGRLALDDTLSQHLPGTAVGGVTLRQLLAHVAGLQREPDGEWWERSAGPDLASFL